MLYNPKTKHIIIRRSYQTLNDKDQSIPHQIIATPTIPIDLPVSTPNRVLPTSDIILASSSEFKNSSALPAQPNNFTNITTGSDLTRPRFSSRFRADIDPLPKANAVGFGTYDVLGTENLRHKSESPLFILF